MKNKEKRSVGRPTLLVKRKRFNFAILPEIKQSAAKIAFEMNKSVSRYIEDLIREDIDRQKAQAK